MTPDRDAEQPAGGVGELARPGQAGHRLRMRGAQQPDAAVGRRGVSGPLVIVAREPLPGLSPEPSLAGLRWLNLRWCCPGGADQAAYARTVPGRSDSCVAHASVPRSSPAGKPAAGGIRPFPAIGLRVLQEKLEQNRALLTCGCANATER